LKPFILSLIIILCIIQLTLAQDGETYQMEVTPKVTKKVRYSGLVEVMPYYGIHNWGNEASVYGLYIGTSHGIQFFDKFFYGWGVGINIENSHIYLPFFYHHIRLDFSKEQARPFISASLGLQIGCYTDTDSDVHPIGMWSNIMFGYQFKNRLYIAAGFTAQDAVFLQLWGGNKKIYGTFGMIAGIGVKF